ncbi:MAG: hypothetical protein Tsb005_10060 [Gammaproteobacteria bacterium]
MDQATTLQLLDAATQNAIIATDLDGNITFFNSGAEDILGYSAKEVIGKKNPLLFYCEKQLAKHRQLLSATMGRPVDGFDLFKEPTLQNSAEIQQWTYQHKDLGNFEAQTAITTITDQQGHPTGLLFVLTPLNTPVVPEQLEDEDVKYLSLAQLPHRQQFHHISDIELRRMKREENPIALMLIDIDSFQSYCETYRDKAAQQCIQKIAFSLAHRIRRAGDFLAYLGGDEFGVVLPNTHRDGTIKLAEQLRLMINNLKIEHVTSTAAPYVTISIGLAAVQPTRETTIKMLMNDAQACITEAKQDGGNCTRISN